jgi:hypothetical protein
MAVSKRTRYEVLKRDNFTCRYCRSAENAMKVDHVTPVALGGSDDPSNLVAACHDCNAGKSSTSPTEATVAEVKAIDMQWAGAIRRVAQARARQRKKTDAYVAAFTTAWGKWHCEYSGDLIPRPNGWQAAIERFYGLGVPVDELTNCVRVACGNDNVSPSDTFRYFCGCVWRVVTDLQTAAKELLDAEATDGA